MITIDILLRVINLNEKYTNKATYNSWNFTFKNQINKDIYKDFSKKISTYGLLDFEYKLINNFDEKGKIAIHSERNSFFDTKVGIGLKGNYNLYTFDDYLIKTKFDTKYIHNLKDNHKGNKVRLKNGRTDYYNLIIAEKNKNSLIGTFGIGIEKVNQYGVNFEITATKGKNKENTDINYGLKFNYKW